VALPSAVVLGRQSVIGHAKKRAQEQRWSKRHSIRDCAGNFDGFPRVQGRRQMRGRLQAEIKAVLDELYRQHPAMPLSFYFGATYEVLPELEKLDPEKVGQMVGTAFLQTEVDHASRAEEMLRCQLARVRHEGNRSSEYVNQIEQQHAQAVKRRAQANQRLDQTIRDSSGRS
jgi:hypothetical protein